MTIYLDTSVIVTALTPELHTDRVIEWFSVNRNAGFATSGWVKTEFASALAMKHRMKILTAALHQQAERQFAEMIESQLVELSISDSCFDSAATIVRTTTDGIRASDALHLAIAQRYRLVIATRDDVMKSTARSIA